MKIFQSLFCALALLVSSTSMAQDSLAHKKALIVKADLLFPLASFDPYFNGGSLTLELGINRRHSFQLTGLLTGSVSTETRDKSIQIIPVYKYFLSKKRAYTGFYSGIYLKGAQTQTNWEKVTSSESYYFEYTEKTLSEGLLVGYQNYIRKRIVIDVLFGMGVRQVISTKTIQSENVTLYEAENSLFDGIIAVNIGYKF